MQCQKLKTYMETGRVVFLPVRSIRPNPSQPRKVFQPEPLQELADSIARHGILQPLSVRRIPGGYELIAGERRLRAAQIAGLSEVPCIVMQMDARESGMAAMVENLQRQDLDFIEEALGIRHLLEEYQMSQEQAARLLGKSQSAVANKLRLLRHSDAVLEALRLLEIAPGDAVYVGDSDVDIETAKNAGLPCISVSWGFRDEVFLRAHGASEIVANAEALLEKLK